MNMLTNLTMQKQSPSGSRSLPSNTVANPRGDVKAITTRSGVSYDGPTIPPTPSPLLKKVERKTKATKDKVQTTSTAHVQPSVVQVPILEPKVSPKPKPKPLIPYPSRLNNQKLYEKANYQMLKFLQIFQRLHFNISFADALLHIPKFGSTFKSLLSNKEKLFELANTPLNENCSAVLLKKLPGKLGDPGRFLIPCDFPMDYNVDPRVPLILERPFLRTARELVDVYGEELILREGDEQLIFHTDTTSKYSNEHRIDTTSSPNSSPCLTPVETSDSLLEEFADKLGLLDPFPLGIGDADFDPEGDILLLENLLNDDSSSPLPLKELNFEECKMIKSSIDDFPPLDVLRGNFMTFSNPLFDSNEEFTSSSDESPPEADVPMENFKIYSNPLFEFDEEYISSNVNPLFNEVLEDIKRGDIDEIDAFLNIDVSTDIEDSYDNSEGDIIYLENMLNNDTIPYLPPEVFLDHDLRSLKDELDNNDLKSMVKVFDPDISAYSFYSLKPVTYEKICSSTCFIPNITMIRGESS
ncbi:hypothetical protein Tco_1072213 [Tanacetum coccineum]